jgi:hypothetical protein
MLQDFPLVSNAAAGIERPPLCLNWIALLLR